MKTLLFIRHGATAGNLEKRYIGRTDEPLCPEGIAQIQALKQTGLTADQLYTSPAQRTRQSAALLFPNLTPHHIPAFWETDFGPFEGHTAAELSDDPAYLAWLDTNCQGPIPGGESVAEFKARCQQAFTAILPTLPDHTTTAFVLHGGVIMAILEAYARPKQDFYAYHQKPGEMTRWVVSSHTDSALSVSPLWAAPALPEGEPRPIPMLTHVSSPVSPYGQLHNPPHMSPAKSAD